MNRFYTTLAAVAVVGSLACAGIASAHSSDADNGKANRSATSTVKAQNNATSTDKKSRGAENRSEVASIVQTLLEVADRDGGIGEEVREVARAQASSSNSASAAMAKLEAEGGVKKFFFGPDYKNLGELRSMLSTTQNSIERLERALLRAGSVSAAEILEEEIDELKAVASSTEDFIEEHEDVFSLFGWVAKFFN